MKQARMRISLEDTLIQEHCAGETERKQRSRLGNRWSTRAEGGWRRVGMSALKSDGFRRLKDEIEGEGLKSEFRRLRDEVEREGADRGPPGWKKGGREYSSDEDGDGPGGEPLEVVYQELTLDVISRVRIYTLRRRERDVVMSMWLSWRKPRRGMTRTRIGKAT